MGVPSHILYLFPTEPYCPGNSNRTAPWCFRILRLSGSLSFEFTSEPLPKYELLFYREHRHWSRLPSTLMPLIYFPPFFLIWFPNRNITLWPQQKILIIGCIMETRCGKYKYLFWPQPPKDSQFRKIFSFPRGLENSAWSISYQQKSLCVMNKERSPKETLCKSVRLWLLQPQPLSE